MKNFIRNLFSYLFILTPSQYLIRAQTDNNFAAEFVEIKVDSTLRSENPVTQDFYINKYAVNVESYFDFLYLLERKLPEPPDYGWENKNLPMVIVSYHDAEEYCAWLTDVYQIEIRLPTESEWILAADKFQEKIKTTGNIPLCIDCMTPNNKGIYGMNGNVWEWTSSRIDNEFNIIFGGSYVESEDDTIQIPKYALSPSISLIDAGFRLVVDAKEMKKFLFADEVKKLIQVIIPEQSNIRVEPYGIFIDNMEVFWEEDDFEIVQISNKKLAFSFCCILEEDRTEKTSEADKNKKYRRVFGYNKKDIITLKKLADLINNRDISLFKD